MRTTYRDIHGTDYFDQVIEEYYNLKRLEKEVTVHNHSWTGYCVALENGQVITGSFRGYAHLFSCIFQSHSRETWYNRVIRFQENPQEMVAIRSQKVRKS
ncbi:hypothetical protein [Streptococcus moroccensis]|uniref:hypothetical protein n=1 Tax=Streptococcus moroccensis TaxID=1451356 RepID=UPI0027D84F4F|nr:hypothetical protein [Streptococcus moroccensis]